jgi:spore coat polysaccharide biosynthesis protein SpsF
MRIGAIIFSRMSSTRLPGKALIDICGKTLLQRVIERTQKINLIQHFCIATSNEAEDDKIVEFANENGIDVYRGSLNNVIERATEASIKYKYDSFLRVCGDRPFLDSEIYDRMITLHKKDKNDLTTNIFPRTVPPGLTGEIIDVKSLIQVLNLTSNKLDSEHLTRYYYNNSKKFKIYNYESFKDKETIKLRLVIDDNDDLLRTRWIVSQLDENNITNSQTNKIISLAKDWNKIIQIK